MVEPKTTTETEPVSWQGVVDAQVRARLRATPMQRLQWLEEALTMAHKSGALERLRAQKHSAT